MREPASERQREIGRQRGEGASEEVDQETGGRERKSARAKGQQHAKRRADRQKGRGRERQRRSARQGVSCGGRGGDVTWGAIGRASKASKSSYEEVRSTFVDKRCSAL
jgi:hypothetical protein